MRSDRGRVAGRRNALAKRKEEERRVGRIGVLLLQTNKDIGKAGLGKGEPMG